MGLLSFYTKKSYKTYVIQSFIPLFLFHCCQSAFIVSDCLPSTVLADQMLNLAHVRDI